MSRWQVKAPSWCYVMDGPNPGIRGGINSRHWQKLATALSHLNMRGYGQTDKPEAIDQYTLLHLTGDMVGLVEALGFKEAVIVGHDWGAPVAWYSALFRPDKFKGVVGLSVPFRPRRDVPPTTLMPQTDDAIFYQLYFQQPGVAEAEFERDPKRSVSTMLLGLSVDPVGVAMVPRTGGWLKSINLLEGNLPSWITEADIDFYANELNQAGFS